ncbi:MAG: carboxypeptidase regulatory-like domain-containing protein, partial [Vicinamibacterales bacterium]|nr:carboxypeptidase regulatory-like domain-containing protein [Vicinamibacterales bacterium]
VGGSYSVRTLNSGTLRKAGAASSVLGSLLLTTGTVDVQAGTFQLNGSGNSIGGTVTVPAGTTFKVNGTSTLQAGLVQSGAGSFEFSGGTVTVLASWAPQGETRVTGASAVFDNAASVTFAALTHTAGFLDVQRPSATITGPFTRTGGTLRLAGNTLTFAGAGLQLLDVAVATTFVNLVVSPTTTLVEVQPAIAAQVSGTLTNLGVIRKTRAMAAGTNNFGLTGVVLDVATIGGLSSVQVDRRDVSHPSAGPDQQTGRFWTMTPSGAGFLLSVTLPHALANAQSAGACRFTGSAWDCGRSSSTATTVTRSGVTTLSDWTVGTNVSPSYSITGTVRLDGLTPMSGVTVALSGAASATATTDANGAYAFPGLQAGTYTVAPSLAGYTFTPATRTFPTVATDQVGDFTGVKVWRVTGTVRDLNDTGVPGITVSVTGSASRSTVTDADGRYAFDDLPEGGTYVVTPAQLSFAFTPESQTFAALSSDQQAAFFLAEVGTFVRYFAEGATSDFFATEIALLNATGEPTTAKLRFLRDDGTVITQDVAMAGLARATVLPGQLPGLESAAFSTVVEASQPVIADRTMRWDGRGYGSHAETSIAAPALEWFLAEGATIGGFNLFYLIQNPGPTQAQVEVTYLLPSPQPPIVRTYPVTANSRFNIWVNFEAPELAAAEVSAVIRSTNNVPIIVERAMYLDRGGRLFDSGHAGAGVTSAATEWLLAEGATGDFFDLFVLVANPQTTAAQVEVDYLLPDGSVLTRDYTVSPQSRFNIWVDLEAPQLASTAVSTRVRSVNDVPIIVERAMWWPGSYTTWQEGHNSVGAVRTSTKWGLADGQVGGPLGLETYILIANTSATGGTANVTLVFEDGTTAVRTFALLPNSRETVPVGFHFPEAAGRRFGAVVESFGA